MKALLRLYELGCSYTEAVEILQKAIAGGHKFENNDVEWGMVFASEHERYLSEKV